MARDGQGQALAGMGVAAGDLDGDGLLDLVVTNFYDRSTIAFQRDAALAAAIIATPRAGWVWPRRTRRCSASAWRWSISTATAGST